MGDTATMYRKAAWFLEEGRRLFTILWSSEGPEFTTIFKVDIPGFIPKASEKKK